MLVDSAAMMEHRDLPPVYIVMGSNTSCKTHIANTLALGLGCAAESVQTSKAGVRTFTRNPDSPFPIVVDTVPFQSTYALDSDWLRFARKWISMNSLRRLFGRQVILVAVVNSTIPVDYIYDHYTPYPVVNWLPLLVYIWREYPEVKFVFLKSDGSYECREKGRRWKESLIHNRYKCQGNGRTWTEALIQEKKKMAEDDVYLARLSGRGLPVTDFRLSDFGTDVPPFLLGETTGHDRNAHKFGPWAPEQAILFGRCGCGKSTLARMLVSGRLDIHDKSPFTIWSGIRGATRKVVRGEGRGWYVVDTPGFGEPRDASSTIYSKLAERKIKGYVQIIEGTYSHYLYVVKKDRIDQLEEKLWNFFCLLFGEDLMFFFTVVVSDADEDWLASNKPYLESTYKGCKSFVCAEFPPVKEDDEEWEDENRALRALSLKALEDELASRERYDVFCYYGRFSSVTATGEIASITGRAVTSFSKRVANTVRAVVLWAYSDIRRLINLLMRDNKIVLVPLIDEDDGAELLQHQSH